MLKSRLIGTIYVRHGIVVQSIGFNRYLPVGRPEVAIEAFCSWGADEIFLIDISSSEKSGLLCTELLSKVAHHCTIPLCVGGGVRSVTDVGRLLEAGADKISMNAAIIDSLPCFCESVEKYGSQCMVAAIDFIRHNDHAMVFDYRTKTATSKKLKSAILEAIALKAGELLITDVNRDGTQRGFDLDLITEILPFSSIPTIWCGGAGHPNDFLSALNAGNLSGIAAGNIFHFSEHSINVVKSQMAKFLPMRMDTEFNYLNMPSDENGRVSKLDDDVLQNLTFEKLRAK